MTSWAEFSQQAPELAEFGKARFQSGVAYLGTLRPDGSPRVHPVTPIIGEQLFLFYEQLYRRQTHHPPLESAIKGFDPAPSVQWLGTIP